MMEFTSAGVVRHAFGFYNPNHAAALIAALLILIWAGIMQRRNPWIRCALGIAGAGLFIMLLMTGSRSGLAMLAVEFMLYCILAGNWKKHWKTALAAAGILLIGLATLQTRLVWDAGCGNRLTIWQSALALYRSNPCSGVGIGRSGELASLFLLPEPIVCRTMVSTHMTLLAETGIAGAMIFWTFALYALMTGMQQRAAYAAFAGLLFAAGCSTLFDCQMLTDWGIPGFYPVSNLILSWSLLGLFAGLWLFLVCRPFKWRLALLSALLSAALLGAACFCAPDGAPEIDNHGVKTGSPPYAVVIYDQLSDVKDCRSKLPPSLYLYSLGRLDFAPPDGEIYFIRYAAEAAPDFAGKRPVILVDAPFYLEFPEAEIR